MAMKTDAQMKREVHEGPDEPIVYVDRYNTTQRINHWITAALFTMLTLSGLSLFHPSLFFLTNLFGGGANTRAIHPWFGVVLYLSFLILFVRFFRLNLPNMDDWKWSRRITDVMTNRHDRLPELGKYNAGQKGVFWGQSALITVMFFSGLVIWDQYFGTYTLTEDQALGTGGALAGGAGGDPDHHGAHLRRHLDQGHGPGDDARQRHRRLGLSPPPQVAAQARQAGRADATGAQSRAGGVIRHRERGEAVQRSLEETSDGEPLAGPGLLFLPLAMTRPI